jgi:hypothetical protein
LLKSKFTITVMLVAVGALIGLCLKSRNLHEESLEGDVERVKADSRIEASRDRSEVLSVVKSASSSNSVGIRSFDVAEFDQAWRLAKVRSRNDEEWILNLGLVIRRMLRQGDVHEVYEKINSELGPGSAKDYLVSVVFSSDVDSSHLAKLFEHIENSRDRAAASAGLVGALLRAVPPAQWGAIDFESLGLNVGQPEIESIQVAISGALSNGATAEELCRGVDSLLISAVAKEGAISGLAASYPFEIFNFFADTDGFYSGDTMVKPSSLIKSMISKDADRALTILVGTESSFSATVEQGSLIREAFNQWVKFDELAAVSWFKASAGGISQSATDNINASLSRSRIASGSLSEAKSIQTLIQDPVVAREVEGWIWGKEREQLRNEVSGKPSETVQAIIDGSSKFDSYWLEEAVHTWVSKDFDAAHAWYEKNWDSLPKEKAQYVAAGFATQAIGQGDVDTARQWAAMIQDAKTKARIEANIAKAASSER